MIDLTVPLEPKFILLNKLDYERFASTTKAERASLSHHRGRLTGFYVGNTFVTSQEAYDSFLQAEARITFEAPTGVGTTDMCSPAVMVTPHGR